VSARREAVLPELLDRALVARLCGRDEGWVDAMRWRLPCTVRLRDGAVTVARADLPVWLEAAAPRRERRAPGAEWSAWAEDVYQDVQARTVARFGGPW
jgi:hypothetical protein